MRTTLLLTFAALIFSACGGTASNTSTPSSAPTSKDSTALSGGPPAPGAPAANSGQPAVPKDGTYVGRGKVTKVNAAGGSVEIDHQEIPGLMPAMKMEFNVSDKSMLNDLKAGDEVKFELEYKHPGETIKAIKKIPA